MALDMFLSANGYCLLMNNADVYSMAKATAQANQNNEEPEAVLARITEVLRGFARPFQDLLESPIFKHIPSIDMLHRYHLETQHAIRSNYRNQPQPDENDD